MTTERESLSTARRLRSRFPIFTEIAAERNRQDVKWGGIPGLERSDDHTYAAVLGEEFGEVCKAWLERDVLALREELVQVAAVAVAWIEELDNGGMKPRGYLSESHAFQSGVPAVSGESGSPVSERCPSCGGDAGDNWFDRSLCPEPCGMMHTRCRNCGAVLGDECPFEAVVPR